MITYANTKTAMEIKSILSVAPHPEMMSGSGGLVPPTRLHTQSGCASTTSTDFPPFTRHGWSQRNLRLLLS